MKLYFIIASKFANVYNAPGTEGVYIKVVFN